MSKQNSDETRKRKKDEARSKRKRKEGEDKAQRLCLKCRKMFPSYHIGNRICTSCAYDNSSLGARVGKGGEKHHINHKAAGEHYG